MRARTFFKLSGMIITGFFVFAMNMNVCSAKSTTGEEAIAGITVRINKYYEKVANDDTVNTLSLFQVPKNIPDNLGVSNVDTYLNVRKGPGTKYEVIGKLPKNAGCSIISVDGDWAKIKSGKVSGYVKTEYLETGDKAQKLAEKYGRVKITVTTDSLNVREAPNTDASILYQLGLGEQFDVAEELVINKEDPVATAWVKIEIDDEYAFVASEYVKMSFELEKAVKVEDYSRSTSVSGRIIETAKKYLGYRYVYGGTSLTNGIDCSAFVQQIYRMYGYSLPRTSRAQATCGTAVNPSNARAGDLVFYGSGSGISHVAICIGNGQIIHASNQRDGIKISNMYYKNPAKVVRILNN